MAKIVKIAKVKSVSPRGFRCIGRAFGPEETVIALDSLKKGELEALKATSHLVVTEGTVAEGESEK